MLTEHAVPIAPRTFHAWAVRAPSKRALWDATITEILAGYYEPDEHGRRRPESLYGSLKMWAHLQREGIPVAKSTVERLMRKNGWQGVRRQKRVRTTIPDPEAVRPPDLVDRQFGVAAPNVLLVADFTYVKLVTGVFVYVAFVIDAYAGSIVGWEASASKHTRFVESALRQAAALRARQGHPVDGAIHHSDAGSQGGFNWSSQHLDHGGVVWPSVRTRNRLVGDGSGRLTVRCGLRCAHQGARTRRGRCSVSFGG
uniref:Integrase, catalytic region n=1 Tax=Mycobacterium sp. (strain KMS) TaxID=189918 RepID=A1UQQ1_MYCSK